jgi:hypothetical protein
MTILLADDLACVLDYLREAEILERREAERRGEPRRSHAMIVEVRPLDERRRACGKVRLGVLRNISRHGVSIFAEAPQATKFLEVTFPIPNGEKVGALIEVAWCHRFGRMCELGGSVLGRDGAATQTGAG